MYVAEHDDLWRSPAMAWTFEQALASAGLTLDDVDLADLYSCFPSSVSFALDALGIGPDHRLAPFTTTGGLPYAGGAGSSYLLSSLAATADRLRDGAGDVADGVRRRHAHDQARRRCSSPTEPGPVRPPPPRPGPAVRRPIVDVHHGPAPIAAYTVHHGRDGSATDAVLVCDVDDARRRPVLRRRPGPRRCWPCSRPTSGSAVRSWSGDGGDGVNLSWRHVRASWSRRSTSPSRGSSSATTTTRRWPGCGPTTPVHRLADGTWLISTYDDIRAISRQPERFSSRHGVLINDPRAHGRPQRRDGLAHPPRPADPRRLPQAAQPPVHAAGGRAGWRRPCDAVTDAVLDALAPGDEIDAVERIASPIPVAVIADLLGIGRRRPRRLPALVRRRHRGLATTPATSGRRRRGELFVFLGRLVSEPDRGAGRRPDLDARRGRGRRPAADPRPAGACSASRCSWPATRPPRSLLSGGLDVLAEHPDQRAALAADDDLLPGAVEECLRWVTPIQAFCRTTTEPVELGGHPIDAGCLPRHALRLGQPGRVGVRRRRPTGSTSPGP